MLIRNSRQAGFSLIEMLLAVTLMAIILALVYGGMRATNRASLRGEDLIAATQSMRMTHQFISRQIHQMLPLGWEGEGEDTVMFIGDSNTITWVGPMPGYLGFGGPQMQRLELGSGDNGQELHFRHAVITDGTADLDAQDPIVLLQQVDKLQFEFLQLNDEPGNEQAADWQSTWDITDSLPLALRMKLDFEDTGTGLVWPDLVASSYNSGLSGRQQNRGSYQEIIQRLIKERKQPGTRD